MMNNIRRILAMMMAVLLIITAMPASVLAETLISEEEIAIEESAPETVEEIVCEPFEETVECEPVDEVVSEAVEESFEELEEVSLEFVNDELDLESIEVPEEPAEIGLASRNVEIETVEAPEDIEVKASDEEDASNVDALSSPSLNYVPDPISRTAHELAYHVDMSVSELAQRLEISEEELLSLSEEDIALYHEMLSAEVSSRAAAGSIGLGTTISNTINTSGTKDYTIKITRSGRYRLTLNASKYIGALVYQGDTFLEGVGHCCNGYTSNWCIDLFAGNTYTFKFHVDSRYSSGSCTFTAVLNLYTDGSYADRAVALPYDSSTSFKVKYSNDFRIFNFTAIDGEHYRIYTTGSMYKSVEICDSDFNSIGIIDGITGKKYFDAYLIPGKTYYIIVHGREWYSDSDYWYRTGSGTIKLVCVDKNVNPITLKASKTKVNPGTSDSIKFTVSSGYASKVRLIVDGAVYSDEYVVNSGKATIKASFHVSGKHKVQVQGYYSGKWSLMSKPKTITVNKKSSLGTPKFSSVINNAGTAAADQNYVLHWYKVKSAKGYIVKVYSGDVMIYSTTVDSTSVTIPGSLLGTPGLYVVDVYGIGKNVQQSKKPASAQITVKNESLVLKVSSTLNVNKITWTAKPTNASSSATYKFDLYNSATGLIQSGSYGSSKTMSYTSIGSGTYFVIASVKDGSKVVSTVSEPVIYIQPKVSEVTILRNGNDAGSSVLLDLASGVKTLQLGTKILPIDAKQGIKWKTSDSKIATVNSSGLVTAKKTGKVTITATATDGSKKSDKITINIKRLVKSIEITGKTELATTKSTTLKATVSPKNATKKTVTWTSSNPGVATVSSKGVVTAAEGITSRRSVVITAKANDESGISKRFTIWVCPLVESVQITKNGADAGTSAVIDLASDVKTLQLGTTNKPSAAIKTVKWKSSDTKIATVSANGLVTAKKTGKVTITATATDGSGMKDTITITVKRLVKKLTITGNATLSSGNTTTLKVAYTPTNATTKKVTWKSSNTNIATVSTKGVVTAKDVTYKTTVTITATAVDGSGVYATHKLTILPKATSVKILINGADAGSTATMRLSESKKLQLTASVAPAAADQNVKWKSSNTDIATVSSSGVVTAKKKGKVVITATAKDGSGKKDIISITIKK